MAILDQLAKEVSQKPGQKTPVERSPRVSGGLAVVSSFNDDGTIDITFNGATFPCFVTNGFVPVVGQSVVVLTVGTQVFALGSGVQIEGTETTQWGGSATAQFVYGGDPNGNVAADEAGDVCVDTETPALWQAPSAGTYWRPVSAFVDSFGVGSAVLPGSGSYAAGLYAVAEGQGSSAPGASAHAEGSGTASGTSAHAEGIATIASGMATHAEGSETLASSGNDHAEGEGTIASGGDSHAEGSQTTAEGFASHAEGSGSIAYMSGQHAQASTGSGLGQYSRVTADATTTSATPVALNGGNQAGVAAKLPSTYDRTIRVSIRVVARKVGGGMAASWAGSAVLDGSQSLAAYRWVASETPSLEYPTVADSGTSAWQVVASLGSPTRQILITVTGEAGITINWTATIELDEVVG